MHLRFKIGVVALGMLILASCKTTDEIEISEQGAVASEELVFALDSLSGNTFESYYSKIATSYKDSSRSFSFKTSTWMISDSVSNFLITFAKFPVVSALVTNDSVTIVNRRSKCYQYASLDVLSEQFGTELSLDNLQDILLGIPTNFDKEKTYYQNTENGLTLCTHGLKDIEKIELENSDEIVTYYTLDDNLKELKEMTLVSFKDTTEINLVYNERELVNGFNSPKLVTVRITRPGQSMSVELDYTKIRANEPEEIQFVIPESYGECN
ncbi:MAG: DUF4292 domain-containing protein [bacterium]|nr:DUF4292 domain-containing protein [bacterium]